MISSDWQHSKVIIKWKMTEEHTEAAGAKESDGWAESLRPRIKPSPAPRCYVEVLPCVQYQRSSQVKGWTRGQGHPRKQVLWTHSTYPDLRLALCKLFTIKRCVTIPGTDTIKGLAVDRQPSKLKFPRILRKHHGCALVKKVAIPQFSILVGYYLIILSFPK